VLNWAPVSIFRDRLAESRSRTRVFRERAGEKWTGVPWNVIFVAFHWVSSVSFRCSEADMRRVHMCPPWDVRQPHQCCCCLALKPPLDLHFGWVALAFGFEPLAQTTGCQTAGGLFAKPLHVFGRRRIRVDDSHFDTLSASSSPEKKNVTLFASHYTREENLRSNRSSASS